MRFTDEELTVLSNSVNECYPIDMIRQLQEEQTKTKSDYEYNILEYVVDIILDHTYFME